MRGVRLALLLALGLLAASAARAQTSGAPVAPVAETKPSAEAAPTEAEAPPPPASPDPAYGAYQRGLFLTAFRLATQRIADDPNDAAAMTLLGELYSRGMGVAQDWTKAANWYRLAAQRGDPQAAHALAMILLDGRAGPKDPVEGRRLLESAAEAVPAAATALALVRLREGTPEADKRAVELLRRGAEGADADAEYGLGLLYREGRGVPKSPEQSAIWMGRAANNRHVSAQVEYAVMLFNGEGIARDERAAAKMFLRAAERGNPIAQNRTARLFAAGRGVPKDLSEAWKWHSLAKFQGVSDPWLDETLKAATQPERDRAEQAVRRWLGG